MKNEKKIFNKSPNVSNAYPPKENIESVINMLSNHCYSVEECEAVNWDANKIEHLDATAFENSVCIKLLGGYDRYNIDDTMLSKLSKHELIKLKSKIAHRIREI